MDSIREHMETYLEWKKAAGRCDLYLKHAKRLLLAFASWLSTQGITRTADVTPAIVHGYVSYTQMRRSRHGEPMHRATIFSLLGAARTFLRWAAEQRLIFYDLSDEFPSTKLDRTLRRTLSAIEAERILSLPDTDTPDGLRDRTILEIFYSTGIRRSELANLRIEDVNAAAGSLFIHEGKGRKDRVVPAGERMLSWIRRYLAESRPVHTAYGKTAKLSHDEGWLFPDRFGGRSSPQRITLLTTPYLRRAGIERGSCHMFRHTAATLMLENGADLRYIQELLGHASIKSTQVYTNVSAAHLKRTMNQSHPVTWEEEPAFSAGMHTGTSTARRCPRRKPGEERPVREVDPSRSALHGALCEYREWIMTTSSHGTAVLYVQHSGHFVEWADARGVTLPGRITPELVQQYQRELPTMKMKNGEPFSIHLIRLRLQAVRSFFRYLWRSGHTLTDPSASAVVPRSPLHLPADVLTVEEVERILAMPDITTTYGIRDRAVIELFYATGMRRSELAEIRLEDVNHENRTVRIVDAKTKDSRMLPVGSRAMRWIETYLECAREGLLRPGEEREHLFICGDGERFSPGTPETICRRHMRAAGVNKRKACHIFRHTVATLMLENGADVRAVQEFLGHRSVQSTERYTHVAIRKLKEVHAKTHPGEKRYLERLREEESEGTTPDLPDAVGPPKPDELRPVAIAPQTGLRAGTARHESGPSLTPVNEERPA